MRYVDCSLVLNYVRLLQADTPGHERAVQIISNYYNIPSEQSESAGVLASWLAPRIFCGDSIQYTGWCTTDTNEEIVSVASTSSELIPILAYEPSVGSVPRAALRARAEEVIREHNIKAGSVVVILNPQLR
jgi:hypothetical protein